MDPIEAIGAVDNYDHPIPIMYITTNMPSVGVDSEDFESEFTIGCSCLGDCVESCPCVRGVVNYVNDRLNPLKTSGLIECNPACTCGTCSNRLVQRGPLDCLEPFQTEERGFGLRTKRFISKNQFICEYAGEVIGIEEALRRMEGNRIKKKMNYVLVVCEHIGEKVLRTCIDPEEFGNIGRYCNHSCEPTAKLVPVRAEGVIPRLGLFASRDIEAGEEVTFDYGGGEERSRGSSSGTRCLCGAGSCAGFLPHHNI